MWEGAEDSQSEVNRSYLRGYRWPTDPRNRSFPRPTCNSDSCSVDTWLFPSNFGLVSFVDIISTTIDKVQGLTGTYEHAEPISGLLLAASKASASNRLW